MELKVISEIPNNINKTITLFGDSHTLCFVGLSIRANKYLLIDKYDNKILIKNRNQDSVSITGLKNNDSKLKYNATIYKNINDNDNNYYMFKLGQVDVEYIYYYKLFVKKENINIIDFFTKTVDNYLSFLQSLSNKNIIVCGINLTSWTHIKYYINYLSYIINIDVNIVSELLKDFTLLEKQKNHLLFNNILEKKCIENNIKYFDLTNECCDISENKINVKKEYLNVNNDHHYNGCNGNIENKPFNLTYSTFLDKLLYNFK
jgi:hypothetical protein